LKHRLDRVFTSLGDRSFVGQIALATLPARCLVEEEGLALTDDLRTKRDAGRPWHEYGAAGGRIPVAATGNPKAPTGERHVNQSKRCHRKGAA
jgi:hypothetical protein